jgi:hypothetical protein
MRISAMLCSAAVLLSCGDDGGDGVPYDPSCGSLMANNQSGVGAGCYTPAREQACPTTRMCFQQLADRNWPLDAPFFCTKACVDSAECGEGAHCCRPPGADGKFCVLNRCEGLCE